MSRTRPSRVDVIGTRLDALTPAAAVDRLIDWAHAREARYACFANVHVTTEARRDPALRAALQHADLVLPDGAPVAWAMRRLGRPRQQRVAGPDTMLDLCSRAEREQVPIYLYGSTAATLSRLTAALAVRFPALDVAGTESPPFRQVDDAELRATADRMRDSGAGLVFVGLGAPRQEPRMRALRPLVPAVLLGVGAAFDFHAGTAARAPRWMQRAGVEWLHRLASDPRRLARRYLEGNSTYLALLVSQLVRRRRLVR